MCISHQTGFGLFLKASQANTIPLDTQQKRIVGTIWTTYCLFYLGRVNFSVVLPALAIFLGVTRAEVGTLGTVFFWIYGIGHFVSGEIGSHVSPFKLVSFGLLVIAMANLAFAFQKSLIAMLILWGINGMAQSTGWAPMFRIIAERLESSQLKRVSTIMPFSYVIGTVITWSLIGVVAVDGNWQIAFWLPGLLTLGVLAFWWTSRIDSPSRPTTRFRLSDITSEIRTIWFSLIAAALAGFVFNGTIIWLPTYILDTGLVAEAWIGFVAALLQVFAIVGLMIARYWVIRTNQVFVTASSLLVIASFALIFLVFVGDVLALLIITIALIALNGAFGLVVSSIPLLLSPEGRASSVTGTINMMSNFFGGMAGFTIGGIVEANGWQPVFGLWAILLCASAGLIWWKRQEETKQQRNRS